MPVKIGAHPAPTKPQGVVPSRRVKQARHSQAVAVQVPRYEARGSFLTVLRERNEQRPTEGITNLLQDKRSVTEVDVRPAPRSRKRDGLLVTARETKWE